MQELPVSSFTDQPTKSANSLSRFFHLSVWHHILLFSTLANTFQPAWGSSRNWARGGGEQYSLFSSSHFYTLVQTAPSTPPTTQRCVLSQPDPKLVTWLLYFTHRSGHTWTIKICPWFKVEAVKLKILSIIYYELKWFFISAWMSQEFFLYKLNSWMSVSEM